MDDERDLQEKIASPTAAHLRRGMMLWIVSLTATTTFLGVVLYFHDDGLLLFAALLALASAIMLSGSMRAYRNFLRR